MIQDEIPQSDEHPDDIETEPVDETEEPAVGEPGVDFDTPIEVLDVPDAPTEPVLDEED